MIKKASFKIDLRDFEFAEFPCVLKVPVDLAEILDRHSFFDLSTLQVKWKKERLLAQFSPSENLDPEKGILKGTLSVLINERIKELEVSISFSKYEEQAIRLPYPFYTHRLVKDKRFVKPAYFRYFQIHPIFDDRILFTFKNREITVYNYSRSQPKPFFERWTGPSGVNIIRLGHPCDPFLTHTHHHGIWIGHASIDGKNFWEEREKITKIEHQNFIILEDGPLCGRFLELNFWKDKEEIVLKEKRQVYVYSLSAFQILDVEMEFSNEKSITMGKTPFGFLAVRVAKCMSSFDQAGIIMNSEGMINEREVLGKRARWCDYSGPVNDLEWNGICIFDSPENPNFPSFWHCRSDGWFCPSFSYDRDYTLEKGKDLKLKYRIFIHRGRGDNKKLERHYLFYNTVLKKQSFC